MDEGMAAWRFPVLPERPTPRAMSVACVAATESIHVVPLESAPQRRGSTQRPFSFAKHARCVEIDGVQGEAVLFSIAADANPLNVTVEAVADAKATLPASVLLINGEGHVLRRLGFDSFVRRGASYSKRFRVEPAEIRILALTADPRFVGQVLDQTHAIATPILLIGPGGAGLVAHGVERKQQLPLSRSGRIRVFAEPVEQVLVEEL
jgi:hypothetical protein